MKLCATSRCTRRNPNIMRSLFSVFNFHRLDYQNSVSEPPSTILTHLCQVKEKLANSADPEGGISSGSSLFFIISMDM